MAESGNERKLQERLAAAKATMSASLQRQAALEKTNMIITWAIIVFVFGILIAGYYRLKTNFSNEMIQQSLVAQGPEIMTQVADAVTETAAEVVPVYYNEAQAKYVEVLPELAVAVDAEMAKFSESATEKISKQMDEALARVEEKQKLALKQAFPDFDVAAQEKVVNAVMKALEEQVEGLTGHILAVTVGDIADLDKTVKAFDTKGLPNTEAELSRLMAHHFLQVLDCELMEIKLEQPKDDKVTAKQKGAEPVKADTCAKGGKK